jgi:8-oxo-dGTP diphosphatase
MESARLTGDMVVLATREDGEQCVLLIRRRWDPFEGLWALPGGHVDENEETHDAARRELAEETGVEVDSMDLVGVYASPGRDPRGRYVTFVYFSELDEMPVARAGDDAKEVRWCPIRELSASVLAFDHHQIIRDTLNSFGG